MEKMAKALLRSEIKKVGDNEYEFIMSDETIDRDGEIIKVDGWDLKNFKKNSVLLWGHRHDIPGIGVVGLTAKEDGALVAKKVRFATEGIYDLADTVRGLVDDKVLKAVSVGYIPKKRTFPADEDEDGKGTKGKKKPRVITEEAELYELSIVNVGSNPNAIAVLKSAEQKAENNPPEEWFTEKLWNETFEKGETEEVEEKPYANEHSCRLKPPDYPKYRRENCKVKHDGKCIDFIYGIKGPKESELQAMRYPKDIWTASAARAHCKSEDGTFEAAAESSIGEIAEMIIEETKQTLDEKIEKTAKPKRRYDGLFAGDPEGDQTKPADKGENPNPFAEDEPSKPLFKE